MAVLIFSYSQHVLSAGVEITVVALDWRLQTFLIVHRHQQTPLNI